MRFSYILFVTFLLILNVNFCVAATGRETVPVNTNFACSARPNCISSTATDVDHRIPPIRFTGPVNAAQELLRRVIQSMPRSEIVKDEPGQLAVIFRSKVFGFVDEAKYVFDEERGVIDFRSRARSGYYDFGVNRSRMEEIRKSFVEAIKRMGKK
jgi:uncharacterized protein (DUF1499 family)